MRGDAIYPQQRATSTTTAQGNRDCHNPGSATLEAVHTAGLHYPESDARFGHFSRYNPGSNLKIRGHSSWRKLIFCGSARGTGLLPQEPRELCPCFAHDSTRCWAPFWRGPASPTHGKRSPPVFSPKKCRTRPTSYQMRVGAGSVAHLWCPK